MPSVTLTPQQQASIDAANAILAEAQKGFDNALSNFNSAKDNFCNGGWWNYLTNCDVKNAQSKALTTTLTLVSLGTFGIPSIINNWTQKKWEKPTSCQNAIDKGILLKWDCDRGTGDCKSVDGCNNRVNQYNEKLTLINNAAVAVEGEKTKLQSAKDNLNTVLDAIAKDPTTSANAAIINNQIAAQKQKDMLKWLFFGLAAVLIVGGAIWIGMKVLGGKSAA